MHFTQRASAGSKILREGKDRAAIDQAVSGDYSIGRDVNIFHAKIVTAMADKHIKLPKAAGIKEQVEPLTGCEFTLFVLFGDGFFTTHLHSLLFFIQ